MVTCLSPSWGTGHTPSSVIPSSLLGMVMFRHPSPSDKGGRETLSKKYAMASAHPARAWTSILSRHWQRTKLNKKTTKMAKQGFIVLFAKRVQVKDLEV